MPDALTATTSTAVDLQQVTDHNDRLRSFVPSQFRGPIVDALLLSISRAIQTVDDDHYDLWLSSQLEVAHGPLLDQWGKLVGETRSGMDGDDYRVFIEARILLNLTDSNAIDVATIAEIITAPSTVRVYQYDPVGYQIIIERESFMGDRRAARVGRFLRACKPAGVAMDISEERPDDFGFIGAGAPGFGIGLYARSL